MGMLEPELVPFFGFPRGELRINLLGMGRLEIMEEQVGATVVDEATAMQQRDRIVEVDVAEVMRDVKDEPA